MVTKQIIIDELEALPPETLPELKAFMEFLRFKAEKGTNRFIKLGGLWEGLPLVDEADIAEARREMWGSFGERALSAVGLRIHMVCSGICITRTSCRFK